MIAAAEFMLTFRLLHILAGVLWVGSVFLFVGFIGPAANDVAPSGQRLLTAAVKTRKAAPAITTVAVVNVLAGWVMWLNNMSVYGSLGTWVGSRFGLVITIGAALATTALFTGVGIVGPVVKRLIDLGNEVAASGGPPTPEQQVRIARLGRTSQTYGRVTLTLLILAVAAMATARYW